MNYHFSNGLATQMGRRSRAKGMIIIGLIGAAVLLPFGIMSFWDLRNLRNDELGLAIFLGVMFGGLGLLFLILGIVNIFIAMFLTKISKSDTQQARFIKYQRDELGLYSHIEYEFTDKFGLRHTNKEHLGYYPGVFTHATLKEIEKSKFVPVKVLGKRTLIDVLSLVDKRNQTKNQVFYIFDEDED